MDTKTLLMKVDATFRWQYHRQTDNNLAKDDNSLAFAKTFATGTSNGQADRMWSDTRSVGAGTANDDIDLYGVLSDIFGATLNFVEIVGVLIINNSTTAGDKLQIGGAGSANNAWSAPFDGDQDATLTLGPNFPAMFGDGVGGLAVTNSGSDVLRVTYDGSSGSIEYDIAIFGRSA